MIAALKKAMNERPAHDMALHPEHLNIVSLCTGGGGLDLGVELAVPSARSVCMVEREAFAVAQLVSAMEAGLMAPAPIWSDARTFNGRQWRGCVDGVIGGIPCQPHSLAGKRLGEEDERDLWSDARRIVVQSGAWFVLIENVRGMLSSGGAERVWRDLHRLGFEVEGGLFTASEVGASHERERLFILGVADTTGRGHQSGQGRHGVCREEVPAVRLSQLGECSQDVRGVGLADAYGQRLERFGADDGTLGREDAGRSSGLCDGAALDDASIARSGRVSVQSWGQDEAGPYTDRAEPAVVNAIRGGRSRWKEGAQRRSSERTADEWPGRNPLFPPGPSDVGRWRDVLQGAPELEPAFRRVADGLATRLDIARVDRLRMLGNGVVPLEAAYAVSTLATRLAGRGSAGAARLVLMMEIAA